MGQHELLGKLKEEERERLEAQGELLDGTYEVSEKLVKQVAGFTGWSEEQVIRSCVSASARYARTETLGKWHGILAAVNSFYLANKRLEEGKQGE